MPPTIIVKAEVDITDEQYDPDDESGLTQEAFTELYDALLGLGLTSVEFRPAAA